MRKESLNFLILWEGYSEENGEISILRYLDNNVISIRERYSKWVNRIGNGIIKDRTVASWLEVSGGYSLWLMSGVFEKSLYKHPYLVECLKLFALEEILLQRKPQEIELDGVPLKLHSIIKTMAAGCGTSVKFGYTPVPSAPSAKQRIKKIFFSLPHFIQGFIWFAFFFLKNISLRRSKVENNNFDTDRVVFIFSYFIHLDRKGLKNGRFISGHWGELPNLLNERGYHLHFLHHFLQSTAVTNKKEGVDYLKRLNESSQNQNLHQFVEGRMSVYLFGKVLKTYLKIRLPIKQSRRLFQSEKTQLDLWPILAREWKSSVYGYTAFQNLLWIFLIEKYFNRTIKYKTGFYLQENQGWERAFIHAWKRHGHGTLTAVQHGIVREWDMRYFNFSSAIEKTDQQSYIDIPSPDFYAINGPAAMRTLQNAGLKSDKMIASEALRYNILLDAMDAANRDVDFGNETRVLLLGDYQMPTTINMMELVRKAALSLGEKVSFTLKCHPACPIDVSRYEPELEIDIQEKQLFKILPEYSFVIAAGATTAALDAYIAGASVLVVLENDNINLSPLKGIDSVIFATEMSDIANFISSNKHASEEMNSNEFFWLDNGLSRWKSLLDKVQGE